MPKINLQPRERMALLWGVAAVVLLAFYLGGRAPLEKYRSSISAVGAARDNLKNIRSLHASLVSAQRDQEALNTLLAARGKNFDLTYFLTQLSQPDFRDRVGINSKPSSQFGPSFRAGETTFTGVSLKELVDFLHKVYSSKSLIIVSLNDLSTDQTDPKAKGLRCRLTFDTPKN